MITPLPSSPCIIVLAGRTNVGKSTLYNRLIGSHKAIVSSMPHTTRDWKEERIIWGDKEFLLIDTGGLDIEEQDILQEKTLRSADTALKMADVILFLIDGKVGIIDEDLRIARLLKKYKKKILVVANKLDKPSDRQWDAFQYMKFGFGEPVAISAVTGGGTGDLLDRLQGLCSSKKKPKEIVNQEETQTVNVKKNDAIEIAIIGKPNVGKSSLLNTLLGEERVIVSPFPHTTREPIDTCIEYEGTPFVILDTAGIIKRTRIKDFVIQKGVEETLRVLSKVDIAWFMVDVQKPFSKEDSRVAAKILDSGSSLILLGNKWDLLIEKNTSTPKIYEKMVQVHFPYLKWVPILFLSAKTGKHAQKVFDLTKIIFSERNKIVDVGELDQFFHQTVKKHAPTRGKTGKKIFLYGITQVSHNPPQFELLMKGKEKLEKSYIRYFENQLREKFGFQGTPIRIHMRTLIT